MYEYRAVVEKVLDGDSVRVSADLGFSVSISIIARLTGLNARELSQPGGKEARTELTRLLPPGTVVVLQSVAHDKYSGRCAAYLIKPGETTTINDQLIADGWAAPWNGKGPRPLPDWLRAETPDR